jgi:hypothetical protein
VCSSDLYIVLRNCCALQQFVGHVFLFGRITFELPEEAGEKDWFQYAKHDEQLNKDNKPKCFAERHAPETFYVKM